MGINEGEGMTKKEEVVGQVVVKNYLQRLKFLMQWDKWDGLYYPGSFKYG